MPPMCSGPTGSSGAITPEPLIMADTVGHPGVLALAQLTLGHHHYCLGETQTAIEQCGKSA